MPLRWETASALTFKPPAIPWLDPRALGPLEVRVKLVVAVAADAALAEQSLDPRLAALQVFALEARYQEGPFPLPASRADLLTLLEAEQERCERAVRAAG